MASLYKQQQVQYLKDHHYVADQVLDVGGADTPIQNYTDIKANRIMVLDNDPTKAVGIRHDINEFRHPDELFASERNPYFDLIFCMNVFEYVWQPYNAIANLYSWLAPGGKLVVNFPFLYPVHNPVGIDYLRYTHEWVQKMFRDRFKFKQVEITILEASEGAMQLKNFYDAEKMHYRKGDTTWLEIGCIVEAVK